GGEVDAAGTLGARRRRSAQPGACAGAGARGGAGAGAGAGAARELVRAPGRRAGGRQRAEADDRAQVAMRGSGHASLRGLEARGPTTGAARREPEASSVAVVEVTRAAREDP